MNQLQNLQKLRSVMTLLFTAHSRLEIAEYKTTIKTILQEGSTNTKQLDSIIEQFLAYCIYSKRTLQILYWIEQNTDIFIKYAKSINEIIRKYIEATEKSKLDEYSANTKQVRLFLAKKILEDGTFSDSLIEICRGSQQSCAKFLGLIQQYFRDKKVAGNVTGLVILCINLLKYYEHISSQNIKSCLVILNYLIKSSQSLQKSILISLTHDVHQILKSCKAQKQTIQLYTSFIKYSLNQELTLQCIENVTTVLRSNIKASQVHWEKELAIEGEYSQAIVQFLQISSTFLKELELTSVQENSIKNKNSRVRSLMIDQNHQQNIRKNLKESLTTLCKDLLLLVDCESVGRMFQILSDVKKVGDEKLYLAQCLTNCMSYHIGRSQKQQLILTFVYFWLKTLELSQKNKLKLQIGFEEQNISDLPEPPVLFFIDYIKKTIQTQFEFEFNRNTVRSACNLLCYLSSILDAKQNQELKKKDIVIQIVKMLLNLNESCQKEYKQFLIKKILKIICVYGKQLLTDNPFLIEVLQDKLIANFFRYKEEVLYLINNNLLTERFSQNILQKLQNGDYLQADQKQLELIFDILVIQNKQKMMTLTLGWQWSAYLYSSGSRIYGKQWNYSERELRTTKQSKMAMYPIQFDIDAGKIEGVCDRDRRV